MALFGGVTLPGQPDLDNIRRLDLLPMRTVDEMMRYGMAIDIGHLEALTDQLTREINELRIQICSYIPPEKLDEFIEKSNMDADDDYLPMNVESTKQMRQLLFGVLGVGKGKDLKLTKSGDISTGKRQMEARKSDHPVVQVVLKYREYSKLKGTYTAKLPRIAVEHPASRCCPVCGLRHEATTMRIHTQLMATRTSTGRYASKSPNLQNIPIRSKFGKETRKAFVASPGTVIVGVDFSQLQLRILAHCAREQKMIWIFQNDKDPHTMTAAWTFGVDEDKVDPLTQRAPSKNVNFALCIAEGQRVLTEHRGLIPIQDVLCCDRVWDGVEWVHHDGVVYRGVKEVITHDGLTTTPDHEVWTANGDKVQISKAVAAGSSLAVSGCETRPIGFNAACDIEGDLHKRAQELPDGGTDLHAMQTSSRSLHRYDSVRFKPSLPLRTALVTGRRAVLHTIATLFRYCSALYQPALRGLSRLRRSWYSELLSRHKVVRDLCTAAYAACRLSWSGYWTDRQQRQLRTGEFAFGNPVPEPSQYTTDAVCGIQERTCCSDGLVLQTESGLPGVSVKQRPYSAVSVSRRAVAGDIETSATQMPVYDLMNAGPRRRFTVEGKLVSNCFGETPRGLFEQLVSDSYGKSGIEVPDWLTLEWCEDFFKKWHGIYTDIEPYMDSQFYRARRYGLVWDLFGRTRLVPEMRSVHKRIVAAGMRQAGNHPIQAPDSGMMRLAMAETQQEVIDVLRREGIWCHPLMTIHDELLVEVEEAYGQLVKDMMVSVFESVLVDKISGENLCRVPIKAEGKIMTCWSK